MTIGDGGHLHHERRVPDQPVLREDHLLLYIQTELVWLDLYLALLAVMLNAINTIPDLHHPHDIVQDHRLHVVLLPLLLEAIPTGLMIRLRGRNIAATALHRQQRHPLDQVRIAMGHTIVLHQLARLVCIARLRHRLHLGHQQPQYQCPCQPITDRRRWDPLCSQLQLDHVVHHQVVSMDLHETSQDHLFAAQIPPIARHQPSDQTATI
jgi:hypothetical protein